MNSKDNYIKIFDTTLRDGEQSPGATISHEEKIQNAEIYHEIFEICKFAAVLNAAKSRVQELFRDTAAQP